MCDTVVVVENNQVLFAKNSDRDPNEAQVLDWVPSAVHPSGSTVRCTWIEIPQVARTHAVLLSRPFWMWGAEIGTNEHGVTIGNEAVFTRHRVPATGLTGMDLLRLALERASTATEAVEVIGRLIDAHGQGGRCGLESPGFRYFSSFIVADAAGAFIVDTAGTARAVEPVAGVRGVSNELSVVGFAREHRDPVRSRVAGARGRRAQMESLVDQQRSLGGAMRALRSHGGSAWPRYGALRGTLDAPCMHGGGLVASQTTASWVSRLGPDGVEHWVTGTSSPCLSLFKPVSVAAPVAVGDPTDVEDADSLWWAHEQLHRAALRSPSRDAASLMTERDALEAEWLRARPDSAAAFAAHRDLLSRWKLSIGDAPDERPWWARRYWAKQAAASRARSPSASPRSDARRPAVT